VILGARELAWQSDVVAEALRRGWTAYAQTTANQRQGLPSLMLIRGRRILLIFLRTTTRPDRTPAVDRLPTWPGVEVYVWARSGWPSLVAVLASDPVDLDP
jgi:hypothetical protein